MGETELRKELENTVLNKKVLITFPVTVFNDFSQYAKNESNDCYWLAIKELMKFKREVLEEDLKYNLLSQKVDFLAGELDKQARELAEMKKPKPRTTFGSNVEEQK